ncbi:MAG: VWA domain-containing protein, partial [Myxococcota bacterium]
TAVGIEARSRLELAKQVVARFAGERVAEGDRVGLVVFGDSAFTLCPLTGDGELIRAALDRVEVGMAGQATALGDALALSVKRASSAGGQAVVVLLTDGRNNAGTVPVEVALALANSANVRVHSVGIGSAGEAVPMAPRAGAPDGSLRFERHEPDLDLLRRLASSSGGRFFAARRSSDLQAVYAEIDALERSPRTLPPRMRQAPRNEPFLALAGGLLFLEIALSRVLRRRLP